MPNHEFKNKAHHISFKIALSGIVYALRTQPNFIIMTLFAIFSIILSYSLKISETEFIIVVWTIFIVFITEMINTSIESITDLVTEEWNQNAKIAKDVSSGTVLLTVIGAGIIGAIIFIPKLILLIS